jgi:aspartate carbamoyltransferase catalytic subunit
VCDANGLEYVEVNTLEEAMPMVDVLYMTRVQQERFEDKAQYERLKDSFILDTEKMALGKKDMIVLHPLPRVNEITPEVDNDPRAAYFRQVENGKFVRMSLIYTLLEWKNQEARKVEVELIEGGKCSNHRCITTIEPAKNLYYKGENGIYRCLYCEHEMDK